MLRLGLSYILCNPGSNLKINPLYKDLIEFRDIFSEAILCELAKDKGTRHEIELKPGSKYCVMKQWPLPREQYLRSTSYLPIALQRAM